MDLNYLKEANGLEKSTNTDSLVSTCHAYGPENQNGRYDGEAVANVISQYYEMLCVPDTSNQ